MIAKKTSVVLLGQVLSLGAFALASSAARSDSNTDYVFDEHMFQGAAVSPMLSKLAQGDGLDPGIYEVDVYVNGDFVRRQSVTFVPDAKKSAQPCFTKSNLEDYGVQPARLKSVGAGVCQPITALLPGSVANYDQSRLSLDVTIPQSLMVRLPRGYVDPKALEAGRTMGYANYMVNQYHTWSQLGQNTNSITAFFNTGLNLGSWHFRQDSYLSSYTGAGTRWQASRSYVERPIQSLRSLFTLGETYTPGDFFSGLSYRGISLKSDDRMLPDSLRGYAPVIRGIAKTNARVTVRQNGSVLTEITVPPGNFVIDDLYPTSGSGDIKVVVTEADGSISSFVVPFSAVPQSLRPGLSRFNIAMGRTRDIGDQNAFGEGVYQYGFSNNLTGDAGVRIAQGYQALVLGGVYANSLGAFGADMTYSHADIPSGTTDGWMARLSYSRTFDPTHTTLTIAGYRYSTEGYRDLGDALGEREAFKKGYAWSSATYQQRSRVEASVNQNLGDWGTLGFSASSQDYRGGRERDTQLQLSYGKMFSNSLSLNLSVSRQRYGALERYGSTAGYDDHSADYVSLPYLKEPGRAETVSMLTVSFPLGKSSSSSAPLFSTSVSHSTRAGTQSQASVSGVAGEGRLSYGLTYATDDQHSNDTTSGSLQANFSKAAVGLNVSHSKDFDQFSSNLRGAVVVHGGGVTFGPYLSDTFGLVHAKGAKGARLLNGQGAAIDSNGYALIPSLVPYRYNSVMLTSDGMSDDVELLQTEKRVAPLAGAFPVITFKTRSGQALLITAKRSDNGVIPLGAEVFDEHQVKVGIAGQNGQIYVRSDEDKGRLQVRWGETASDSCSLNYSVESKARRNSAFVLVNSVCSVNG